MSWLPWDTLLLIVVVDVLLWVAVSVVCGVLVARATGSAVGRGILVGALLPGVGPSVWSLTAAGRNPEYLRVGSAVSAPWPRYVGGSALMVAALLFALATPSPWGEVEGAVDEYALAGDSAASDTPVGLTIMVVTILLCLLAAGLLAFTTARTRAALVAALVGVIWATVTIDGLLAFSALTDLSAAVDDASGGRTDVYVGARGGLWFALGGALLALAVMGFTAVLKDPQPHASSVRVPLVTPTAPPVAADDWSTDWGNGSAGSRRDAKDGW